MADEHRNEGRSIDRPLYIDPPRKITILCRDLIAADSILKETIELAEELEQELRLWRQSLEVELENRREADGRELRRRLRSNERS